MVTAPTLDAERLRQSALRIAGEVPDPEIPVITIADLGVLRDARVDEQGRVELDITPTYSGCPAMTMIAQSIEIALAAHGLDARVRLVLSPAWTTGWMTQQGRDKLRAYGIAPPPPRATRRALFGEDDAVACPRCDSTATEKLSEFGSTPCKALWRCTACREPFDHFKCL
ncbi:MAG TPA: 1,2-phenylacetyl-CoA epoxidase subunit PaaD [Falsiroseomonas sp.]|jgi:ring-1,2-phenylacetyl-CoA epoxidase subunit PaaD|nr:1,2-phenylacetyl-CoA epoxidase subunit PaaD [Falsiroseomonas sp.]